MASPASNAIRYDIAQRKIVLAMQRINAQLGVPIPPPIPKPDGVDHRRTMEAERLETFLTAIADAMASNPQLEQTQ
jgi:hypothetical protein